MFAALFLKILAFVGAKYFEPDLAMPTVDDVSSNLLSADLLMVELFRDRSLLPTSF